MGVPKNRFHPQPSPHFSYSEINALLLNGQQAVTAISALWLRRSTAFRWLQQPIGRHLMIDVVEQVIERHQEVKNEGISEGFTTEYRNLLFLILAALLLAVLGCHEARSAETALERIRRTGEVRLGYAPEPPFSFRLPDGR